MAKVLAFVPNPQPSPVPSTHPHGSRGYSGRQTRQPPPPPRHQRAGAATADVVVDEVVELVVIIGLAGANCRGELPPRRSARCHSRSARVNILG
jgi:hypothetical protein